VTHTFQNRNDFVPRLRPGWAPSSNGKDSGFSIQQWEFDSPRGYEIRFEPDPAGNPSPARHGTAEGEVMYIGIGTLLIIIILLAILL
jgi:hypothetical protein